MEERNTLLINQSTIKELLDIADFNNLVHQTFQGLGDGTVINPT